MRAPFPLLALVATGCVLGADQVNDPRDLADIWDVDRLRLLAATAEPPEVGPGDEVTFELLLVGPEGRVQPGDDSEVAFILWQACFESGETDDFGCGGLTGDDLDFEDLSPDDLDALGIIGAQPFVDPSWTVPDDALEGLDDRERLEGTNALINVTAITSSAVERAQEGDTGGFDFNDVEAGFKRVVISEAITPNANPTIDGLQVHGRDVPQGSVVELDPGELVPLTLLVPDEAVERYVYVTRDGEEEERVEEPYAEWYTTAGTVGDYYTLHPFNTSIFETPDEGGVEGTWWVVLKDRRGGQAWHEQRFRVREGTTAPE